MLLAIAIPIGVILLIIWLYEGREPTPAPETEDERKARLIRECHQRFFHFAGADTTVVNPIHHDRLSCMFCPFDMPIPEGWEIVRGFGAGRGYRNVRPIEVPDKCHLN